MTVEQAIVARLRSDVGVTAIASTRTYQMKLPQSPTLPAVLVQLINEPVGYHLRGAVGLRRSLVQVDAFANEYDAANPDPYATATQLADAIDAALSGQIFTDSGSPPSVSVTAVSRESRIPMYDPDEVRIVRVMQEYAVWWTRAA